MFFLKNKKRKAIKQISQCDDQLLREIRIIKELKAAPYILKYLDSFCENVFYFIVTDYHQVYTQLFLPNFCQNPEEFGPIRAFLHQIQIRGRKTAEILDLA
jgi:hypothetical protein